MINVKIGIIKVYLAVIKLELQLTSNNDIVRKPKSTVIRLTQQTKFLMYVCVYLVVVAYTDQRFVEEVNLCIVGIQDCVFLL